MSALFKGFQGLVLISEEPAFDVESGLRQFDTTWAGSKAVIFGFANDLEADGISYRVGNNGPVYFITARVPQNQPTQEELDRYEIYTESDSPSLFELPQISLDAQEYDSNLSDGEPTYREVCEQNIREVVGISADNFVTDIALRLDRMNQVIRHLRQHVTGFEQDNLVLSRFRKIDRTYANAAGQFNLEANRVIYTTSQLDLPGNVAFSVSALPAGNVGLPSDYRWGWKLRGQRVELVGVYVEQTIQLLFAPWSTLSYSDATGNLAW